MRFFSLSLLSVLSFVACASASTRHSGPTIYLLRHGEKDYDDPDNHYMNGDGYRRAECLRTVFGKDSPYNIGYMLAPKISRKNEHRRSYDTLLPLARDLGLPLDIHCKHNKPRCLRNSIKRYDGKGNVVISWCHGKMQQIAEELGVEDPPEYPEERFDIVWTIPFPYDKVTEIWSEKCPGLDDESKGDPSPLKVQR